MSEYLLFRLYGPLASWGETAVGEVRPTAAWPGRSAVLGLLAAALGIRRYEEDRQRDLATTCGVAVCVESSGELLRDYHTVQVPPERRGVTHLTRRDEVCSETLNTLLSQRDYRNDALYTIAIWRKGESQEISLQKLAQALFQPHYALYLGRKSCPLALPLAPQLVNAADLRSAFDQADFLDSHLLAELPQSREKIFLWEDDVQAGMEALYVNPRRDEPTSRKRWQFGERNEYYRSEQNHSIGERGIDVFQ